MLVDLCFTDGSGDLSVSLRQMKNHNPLSPPLAKTYTEKLASEKSVCSGNVLARTFWEIFAYSSQQIFGTATKSKIVKPAWKYWRGKL